MEPWIYLEAPEPLSEIAPWDGNLGTFTHYFGYSVLGHVLLAAPQTGDVGILYPLENGGFKSYGVLTPETFRATVLDDADFRGFALPASLLTAVAEAAGPLDAGEVYFPVPYPFIGGSGEPSTYRRGEFGVFASLVGQFLGLSSR